MPTYIVKPGDTLSKIGQQYGVDYNNITGYRSGNPNLIYPGESLMIPDNPIQKQLPEQPAGTSFKLDVPTNLSSKDVEASSSNIYTTEDIMSKLKTANERIASLGIQTQAEKDLQAKINKIKEQQTTLRTNLMKTEAGIEGEPISAGAMAGRKYTEEKFYNLNAQTLEMQEANLLSELGIETKKREGEQTTEKDVFDNLIKIQTAINNNKVQLMNETDKLSDNARQALNTILTNFKGVAFTDLDTTTQLQIQNLATKNGIPIGVISAGMNNNAQQQKLDNIKKNQHEKPKNIQIKDTIDNQLIVNNLIGSDKKVSWETYRDMLQTWINNNGTESEFYLNYPISVWLDVGNQKEFSKFLSSNIKSNITKQTGTGSSVNLEEAVKSLNKPFWKFW
jgi:hypothetical protein